MAAQIEECPPSGLLGITKPGATIMKPLIQSSHMTNARPHKANFTERATVNELLHIQSLRGGTAWQRDHALYATIMDSLNYAISIGSCEGQCFFCKNVFARCTGCQKQFSMLAGRSIDQHSINIAALKIDPLRQDDIIAHLKTSSRVASISTREGTLRIFYDMMSHSMLAMITIILIFASAISVGVVYNTAMILLSERTFELGSLRILGFTKAEVFEMIASELGTTILASLVPGCALGYLFAWLMMNTVDTEEFTIKLIISSRTYVTAMLVSLGTAVVSFVILYFRIRKMDLVSVLKVRE